MRADLLDRVQIVCPACTWKKGAPAEVRLERGEARDGEIEEGALRCVRCGETYPILQGVAVLAADGYRRVARETAEVEDPVRLAGPHLLAHYGDLLPEPERTRVFRGDFWASLAALEGEGLAVDLSASLGRAVAGLTRSAAFTLGCEASFLTARLARGILRSGEATIRVVREGLLAGETTVRLGPIPEGPWEIVVADPERPPLPPGIAGFLLAANVLERQGDPEGFLRRGHDLLRGGGSLVVASPYTWWPEHAPPEQWIGKGTEPTRDALVRLLTSWGHRIGSEADLHLVLREHDRLEQVVRPHLVRTYRDR